MLPLPISPANDDTQHMRNIGIVIRTLDLVSLKEITASRDTIYDTTWEPPVGTTVKCSVTASFLLLKKQKPNKSCSPIYTSKSAGCVQPTSMRHQKHLVYKPAPIHARKPKPPVSKGLNSRERERAKVFDWPAKASLRLASVHIPKKGCSHCQPQPKAAVTTSFPE